MFTIGGLSPQLLHSLLLTVSPFSLHSLSLWCSGTGWRRRRRRVLSAASLISVEVAPEGRGHQQERQREWRRRGCSGSASPQRPPASAPVPQAHRSTPSQTAQWSRCSYRRSCVRRRWRRCRGRRHLVRAPGHTAPYTTRIFNLYVLM